LMVTVHEPIVHGPAVEVAGRLYDGHSQSVPSLPVAAAMESTEQRGSTIDVHMAPGGGFAIMLTSK
ncbi:MAG: hypothetical protein ACI4AH_06450, partial [Muribaculaceae bacterium]